MKVIRSYGRDDLAMVYVARTDDDKLLEFVESIQPPRTIEEKWVLIVSTLYGCPVNCLFCDAGGNYEGKISVDDILKQIDFMVKKRFNSNNIPVEKIKIQFARMGEPSLNNNVLEVLNRLPEIYNTPNLIPCISTIAPCGTDDFFNKLLTIKRDLYMKNFQLQFSIHSTDVEQRDKLIPIKKWDFHKISNYGEKFYDVGGRKITLNFAINNYSIVEPKIIAMYFSPEKFLIKITPINPTFKAEKNNLTSKNDFYENVGSLVADFKKFGFDTILSIGELEENQIGSNCGMYINRCK